MTPQWYQPQDDYMADCVPLGLIFHGSGLTFFCPLLYSLHIPTFYAVSPVLPSLLSSFTQVYFPLLASCERTTPVYWHLPSQWQAKVQSQQTLHLVGLSIKPLFSSSVCHQLSCRQSDEVASCSGSRPPVPGWGMSNKYVWWYLTYLCPYCSFNICENHPLFIPMVEDIDQYFLCNSFSVSCQCYFKQV